MQHAAVYESGAQDGPARVEIYRPFFLAGMLSVLTTGCLLGAVAMMGISLRASYTTSAWSPFVMAHANSQVFGWVGLFIMGFSLQQHPPRSSRSGLFHRLAWASLTLVLVSIGLRFAAEPLVTASPAVWLPVGIASGVIQALAVALFAANIGLTRCRVTDESTGEEAGLPWQSLFVFTSLAWWLATSLAEPLVFALSHQASELNSILFVAKWFVPFREGQFLGFVANMIFGVALARLSVDFGFKPALRGVGIAAFLVWNTGVALRIAGWLRYFAAEMDPSSSAMYAAGGILLASGAVAAAVACGVFSRTNIAAGRPAAKFVRAAFAWLLISGALLLFEPAHLGAIGQPFSHAYTGAIRHAVTVGFISQMILGVSTQAIPRLRGLQEPGSAPLWGVFLLLNLGNGARVAGEVATDYTRAAFAPMGITGFIELTGLLLWAVHVSGLLLSSTRDTARPAAAEPVSFRAS